MLALGIILSVLVVVLLMLSRSWLGSGADDCEGRERRDQLRSWRAGAAHEELLEARTWERADLQYRAKGCIGRSDFELEGVGGEGEGEGEGEG